MCQVKCHLKWDLSHLAKTSLKVCRKPFEMLKRNATKSHFINHKYKCWSCLLKDDNITAIWLFKELDIAQSRHIILCKKECFSCTCIYRCTFSYNRTLLVQDMLQMCRRGHSTKVKNFFHISPNPNTLDLSSGIVSEQH